ncbi:MULTISPECIES: hypothetical protein [Streptomyces]|uniref:Uncharacterized protein n=1 Tax=Streptomyces coerulescens TaxID=29304 RepID=A0ABW0CUQ6_STRCD
MTLRIGEISNEVAVDGPVPAADRASGHPGIRRPDWVERDRFRQRAEACARDAARTAEEARHG